MASSDRTGPTQLESLATLQQAPHKFDLFEALRRVECAFPGKARLGQGQRPLHEAVRLGQEPSMAFAPSVLAGWVSATADRPARLVVNGLGLWGPSGPMPLHLTEYARDRSRNAGDPTLARFLDIFHHRALSLFYRAWANSRPTVAFDRPNEDRFAATLGSLCGQGTSPRREDKGAPEIARLFFAGRLAAQPRNAEGLAAMLQGLFGLPATVEPFVGEWLSLSPHDRWHLGRTRALGQGTVLGARTWQRQSNFRVAFGPLDKESLQSLLPGGSRLPRVKALINHYAGPALAWDLRLRPAPQISKPWRLGQEARLGWTTWLGSSARRRQDIILNPARNRSRP
jgi:type VI secretion system protein ImpH